MMVLKNTIFQATGQAGSKALVFCLFVYLARSLSVESFGQFNFIYAYVAVFGIFMDFGLDLLVTKLIAISPMNLKYIFSIFKFKIICIVTVLTLYVVINWGFRNINSPTIYILAVIGTALYSFITFIYGIYRGKEVLRYEALFAIIHKFIFLLLSILFVHYGFSIAGVFSALVFASVIVLVWLGYDVLMRYGALIICRNILKFKDITNIIKESLPFLVINLCTIIYFRVDTLMLSYLKSNYDVGIYNAAYRLMEGMIFIPGAFMTAYFPVLVRASNSAISSLVEKFKVGLFTLIIMGIFISGVLFAGSNTFIVFFWGQRYIEAVPILKLLAVALFIIHINYIITQSAIAQNKEKAYMITVACAVIINIGLNFPLIKLYDAMGAAFSTIITELFLGLVLFISTFQTEKFQKQHNHNDQ